MLYYSLKHIEPPFGISLTQTPFISERMREIENQFYLYV